MARALIIALVFAFAAQPLLAVTAQPCECGAAGSRLVEPGGLPETGGCCSSGDAARDRTSGRDAAPGPSPEWPPDEPCECPKSCCSVKVQTPLQAPLQAAPSPAAEPAVCALPAPTAGAAEAHTLGLKRPPKSRVSA